MIKLFLLVAVGAVLFRLSSAGPTYNPNDYIDPAYTQYKILFSPLPSFGATIGSGSISMTTLPATIANIQVTNLFSVDADTCTGQCSYNSYCYDDRTASQTGYCGNSNTDACLGGCTCTNPVGAAYQCTILATNPPSAINKVTFSQSFFTTPSGAGVAKTQTICILSINSALTTGDYIQSTNAVFVNVRIQLVNLINNTQPCDSGSLFVEGWYNFTVTPITTTTTITSTTTRTTTTTTTSTSTSTTAYVPAPASTSTTTTTTTTTTTKSPGTTETTTAFFDSTAGLATIIACAVVGAVLLILAIYFIAKSCGACSGAPPSAPTTPAVDSSIGVKAATRDPNVPTGPTETRYSYYNVQQRQQAQVQPPTETPNSYSTPNSTQASYAKQTFPKWSTTPPPSMSLTPVN